MGEGGKGWGGAGGAGLQSPRSWIVLHWSSKWPWRVREQFLRALEFSDPPVAGSVLLSHTFPEARPKLWSHPGPGRTKDKPLPRPLPPPLRCGSLRQCSAAIFWPHATLHPHPPGWVNPARASVPRGGSGQLSFRAHTWRKPTPMSPGRVAPQHQTQPWHTQRAPLPLERESVQRTQEAQGPLSLLFSPSQVPGDMLGLQGREQ